MLHAGCWVGAATYAESARSSIQSHQGDARCHIATAMKVVCRAVMLLCIYAALQPHTADHTCLTLSNQCTPQCQHVCGNNVRVISSAYNASVRGVMLLHMVDTAAPHLAGEDLVLGLRFVVV